jgi:1-deoxy-D-xylulose-5-phosphate reductoisomerase
MVKNVVVLGSTGSIGRNTLAVLGENKKLFRLLGLAAGTNSQLLGQQISEFDPPLISVKSKKHAQELRKQYPEKKIFFGTEGLLEIVSQPQVDTIVAAITGTTALAATLQAIRLNLRLCLANKETLVAAGELINRELSASRAEIIPVDSEQSAIFQCLASSPLEQVRRVILTASGGPFFKDSKRDFSTIRVQEALAHPTWSMGKKITVDSATLMNKALEIIEAHHLFKLSPDPSPKHRPFPGGICGLCHVGPAGNSRYEIADSLFIELSRAHQQPVAESGFGAAATPRIF